MSGGIFLLLCVLAFLIGTRAQKSRAGKLSTKALRQQNRIKFILMWVSFALVLVTMILYAPALYEKITIAIDTHFDWDTILSAGLFAFGLFTVFTIYQSIKKIKKANL